MEITRSCRSTFIGASCSWSGNMFAEDVSLVSVFVVLSPASQAQSRNPRIKVNASAFVGVFVS